MVKMAIYRTTLRGTAFGQAIAIVRYWNASQVSPDLQQFVDAWGDTLEGTWDAATHSDVVLTDVYVSLAASGSLGIALTPANFPLEGLNSPTTALPNHDAVLIVYTSGAFAYPRQNRNRLVGADESHVTGGVLNTVGRTAWELVMDALSTSFQSGLTTWTAYLWSDEYQQGNVLTGRAVREQISTQRSRRLGVGA